VNGFGRRLTSRLTRPRQQAPAFIAQSTARDLMMEGLLRLPVEAVARLRAFVHDELVFTAPADAVEDFTKVVLDALQFEWAPEPWMRPIGIVADVSRPGHTWGDCYDD
jgi:DNA polymerase-1